MAYVPLSQRVAARMREIQNPTPKAEPPFDWNTPERTRTMAHMAQPAKKRGGYGMTNAQIIRQLRQKKR